MTNEYLIMWYDALKAEVGIVVETNDPVRCKQKLYQARKEANDPDLEVLSVLTSPTNPKQLVIARKP